MTEIRTLEDVQRHNAKVQVWRSQVSKNLVNDLQGIAKLKPVARPEYVPIRERKRGMNGLEKAYASRLETLRQAGEVDWYEFEPMRLKLADDTYYRPDFAVVANGELSFHETKGHMREAARVRLNVAASKFPFAFYLVKKDGIGFKVNRVSGQVPRGTGEGE